MMKNLLTRYRPRYLRSIVYMLQASEYDIRGYLRWYRATKNFSNVERRSQLVKTPKATLLLLSAWAIVVLAIALAVLLFSAGAGLLEYIVGALILVLLPRIVAYGILAPLVLGLTIQWPITLFLVGRARRALTSHNAVKIGIAGSFGKTTMREILKTVLSEGKKVAAPPHSHNTPLGISKFVKGLSGDEEVLIFEFGEYYPGDIAKLCKLVQPDMGIIAGINEAHLAKFKSLERTVATIYELGSYLGDKPVYVNAENELARKHASPSHILYSREGVGGWSIAAQNSDLSGTSFVLKKGDTDIALQSALLGLHQVGPLAAAFHTAVALGLSPEQARAGVGNTKPFEHRLNPVSAEGGVVTLDDSYNGNPDGVRAVIFFLKSLSGRRRFYVTPGLVEMGVQAEMVHREIGRELARAGIEKVVLVKNSVTPHIEAGLRAEDYAGDVLWFDDGPAAFAALPQLTVEGDVVLLQNDWPDQYQ